MKGTTIITILISMLFVFASPGLEDVPETIPLANSMLSRRFAGLMKRYPSEKQSISTTSTAKEVVYSMLRKVESRELNRFVIIHRRQDSNSTVTEPNLTLQFNKTVEKSGFGDTVKKVEKKWVKIVEIVVPIAVGIPLLIILGISCFLCCACCKARRN